jgi:hypothetical protein
MHGETNKSKKQNLTMAAKRFMISQVLLTAEMCSSIARRQLWQFPGTRASHHIRFNCKCLKGKQIGGRACKPDSVRRKTLALRRDDHSSRFRIAPELQQPTRGSQQRSSSEALHTGWASPPLLFGLAPRGVCHASNVAIRAVGSYPTFSPLPNSPDHHWPALGFASSLPPRSMRTGGLSFCGTFRSCLAITSFRQC